MDLSSLYFKSLRALKENSPTLLCVLAAAGVVGTAVSAVNARHKARCRELDIRKTNFNQGKITTDKEIFIETAPCYIPPVLIGLGTIGCIFGANALNEHKQASILSAYALLRESYEEYKQKVIDIFGEDGARQIIQEIGKDRIANNEPQIVEESEDPLFYDPYCDRYFNLPGDVVKDAEMKLNRNYAIRGYSSLNEYYALLGIPLTDKGEEYGWETGYMWEYYEANWIDFNYQKVTTDDGLECRIIWFVQEPDYNPDLYQDIAKQIM